MSQANSIIDQRLSSLEKHLEQENPILLSTVQSFRRLDRVAYRLGLLQRDQSFATQIPWWPLISILGTFSSGKSTFINHYLDYKLQRTGNQAVDDKFTVVCFSREQEAHSLPGIALDSDPRFPFYQMSDDIEQVASGEGERIDAYLQLKTCPSEHLRGKILIDSPGFDADAQRTSTLRITDHIISLSDLVLVFFDARHPEPGAMHDTLKHLVTDTIKRPDSGKFLYILNQIDTTAREDNPEDVVAAWQRALGECGLTAGRFYTTYNPDAAIPIENEALRERFEGKRNKDLGEIHARMHQVEIERAYRIVGALDKTVRELEESIVPAISDSIARWRKGVVWTNSIIFSLLFIGAIVLSIKLDYWQGLSFKPPWLDDWLSSPISIYLTLAALAIGIFSISYLVRMLVRKPIYKKLAREDIHKKGRISLANAFFKNTRPWRSIFSSKPAGWGRRSKKQLKVILQESDNYVQSLNDSFTNPSGERAQAPQEAAEPSATASAENMQKDETLN
ncbi:MAG: dynamin family protein [gamma proteobacterium symbiont of Bathyaustriella thionipta]|nr:dynamin family protein [gamma proteobacterium symbiont of Bathyaustriella thionipta]